MRRCCWFSTCSFNGSSAGWVKGRSIHVLELEFSCPTGATYVDLGRVPSDGLSYVTDRLAGSQGASVSSTIMMEFSPLESIASTSQVDGHAASGTLLLVPLPLPKTS